MSGTHRVGTYADAARHGALVAGAAWIAAQTAGVVGPFTDAAAYWASGQAPWYTATYGLPGAFAYSPAFAYLVAPITWLPWPAFTAIWATLLFGSLAWLSGRWLPVAILAPPVAFELYAGNIHILLAAAVVLGFRYPAVWAFVALSKVTPAIGLLWFVVRRDWRSLGLALGATAVILGVAFAIGPTPWFQWAEYVLGAAQPTQATALPIPHAPRVAFGVVIVCWGGLTNRPWTVPVAAMLALPVIWMGSLSMLAAIPAIQRREPSTSREPSAAGLSDTSRIRIPLSRRR